jgi:WD40 repeat protein
MGHEQSVYAVAAAGPDRFFSVGGDGMLVLWNFNSGDGTLISRLGEALYCLAIDVARNRVCVGTRSGEIVEFDFLNKILLRRWQGHSGAVFVLRYEDEALLSAGHDGRVVRWDARGMLKEKQLWAGSVRALVPDGSYLWLCGAEGKLVCLNKNDLSIVKHVDGLSGSSLFALQKNENGIFLAGRDAKLHFVPLQEALFSDGRDDIKRVDAHWFSIHALALSPDGKYLASGSMDKTLKIWDAEKIHLLKVVDRERYEAHGSSVNSICWLNTTTFISCGDDRRILAFELDPSPIFAA